MCGNSLALPFASMFSHCRDYLADLLQCRVARGTAGICIVKVLPMAAT